MKKIRVLVAEDSLTVRKRLVEVLGADSAVTVVGEAADGRQAVDKCRELRPDVVTMDMMMPVMDGLAATEQIMAHAPTPILVVSASFNRGEAFRTCEALAAGAVDVIEKPAGDEREGAWERRFVAAVKLVSRIPVITHPRAKLGRHGRAPDPAAEPVPSRQTAPGGARLVAIGASTGGPAAVQTVLAGLPRSFPLPILVVIHISAPFAAALAEWLDATTGLPVRAAVDGEPLPDRGRPVVLMAPADAHLLLEAGRLRLWNGPERHSCKPSVDVLFESLAREVGPGTIACLLTGMGRDGARGLLAIRQAGGRTLAQDESTSIVYGMPREAALLGAAERVVRLDEVAPALADAADPTRTGTIP